MSARLRRVAALLLLLPGIGVTAWGLAGVLPPGVDFYHWYYLVPQGWLAGETRLFDEASRGYYLPPWAVWLFLPYTFFEARWGMALFTITSLVTVAAISYRYAAENGARRPGLVALPAVLSAYAIETYILGMPDTWSLLGIFGAFLAHRARRPSLLGLALVVASVRPQNILLTAPALLLATRGWSWPERFRIAVAPAAVLLLSVPAFGWDWPLRWYENYQVMPPSHWGVTTTYTALQRFGVPFWVTGVLTASLGVWVLVQAHRQGIRPRVLDITLAAGAIVAPYIRGPSYVVLMALSWAGLASRRPSLAAACYLLTFPTLLIPFLWYEQLGEFWLKDVPLVEVAFPIVLLAALVLEGRGRPDAAVEDVTAGTAAGPLVAGRDP